MYISTRNKFQDASKTKYMYMSIHVYICIYMYICATRKKPRMPPYIYIYIRMYISTRKKFQDASNEFATAFGSAI